jgi:hypothetical protein
MSTKPKPIKEQMEASILQYKMEKKMKKILFVVALIIAYLLVPQIATCYCPEPDSTCFWMFPNEPQWGYVNPDSVMVDSCDESPTYKMWYAKKYDISFNRNKYYFSAKPLPYDSLVTWEAIDTSFHEVREAFKQIYDSCGKYKMKRSELVPNDSLFLLMPKMLVFFTSYKCAPYICDVFMNINGMVGAYLPVAPHIEYDNVDDKGKLKTNQIKIITYNNLVKIVNNSIKSTNTATIYDLYGRLVLQKTIEPVENGNEIIINISELNDGFYFLKINDKTYKFIKY